MRCLVIASALTTPDYSHVGLSWEKQNLRTSWTGGFSHLYRLKLKPDGCIPENSQILFSTTTSYSTASKIPEHPFKESDVYDVMMYISIHSVHLIINCKFVVY